MCPLTYWSQRYHGSNYSLSATVRQLPNPGLNTFALSLGVILPVPSFISRQGREGETENP